MSPPFPPRTAARSFLAAGALCWAGVGFGAGDAGDRAPAVSARRAAAAVDRVVDAHLAAEGVAPAPPAADADFLRRVTLDVAGRLPSPAERDAFADSSGAPADRRAAALNRLLNDPGYAANWAFYWKDVIYKRATDRRAALSEGAFLAWMTDNLDEGRGWDAIAADLLTATGDTRGNGATGLIAAQGGEGGEVAAEASRIFLGVQIQCAECHDHPYDRWKREDFHALAAYFPRVRLKRTTPPGQKGPPGFEVVGDDAGGGDPEKLRRRVDRLKTVLVRRFRFLDKNDDGGLDLDELEATPAGPRAARVLRLADGDADGKLSRAEAGKLALPPGVLANAAARTEHLMPDLQNPERPGTVVDPRFFLTGEALRGGLPDARRRATAARLVTDENNVWFARAAVNRVWTELVGEGFYSPVDDIGPDRSAQLEEALDVLAGGFVASGYDLRWLVRAVCSTETYARALDSDAPAFAAAKPTRLRANQIYNSVVQVTGLGDLRAGTDLMARFQDRRRGRGMNGMRGKKNGKPGERVAAKPATFYENPRAGLAGLLESTFGYDPSTNQADLTGDIPQALFLMNGPLSGRLASARGFTPLGRVLRRFPAPADDPAAVRALYQLVLVRDPAAGEERLALAHVRAAGDRADAYEDLMWALLNGSEFLTKR